MIGRSFDGDRLLGDELTSSALKRPVLREVGAGRAVPFGAVLAGAKGAVTAGDRAEALMDEGEGNSARRCFSLSSCRRRSSSIRGSGAIMSFSFCV